MYRQVSSPSWHKATSRYTVLPYSDGDIISPEMASTPQKCPKQMVIVSSHEKTWSFSIFFRRRIFEK